MTEYEQFLASKRILAEPCGFDVAESDINPMLFPFQRDIVRWALRRGKAAVFAHTGLGKGPIQMEWCRHVSARTGGSTLILAPLAVSQQFVRESAKFHEDVIICRDQSDVKHGRINVTNYERIERFDLSEFVGVAMDESSCIKDWTSKTAQALIEKLAQTPYKLCSTATPSPNDHAELGTHAELLDVMRRAAMLAMFFEHDGGETSKWVLKGHGRKPFWRFVASWAVCIQKPSDLGYPDAGFDLPPLRMHEHIVEVDHGVQTDGMLFRCPDLSATGLHKELRLTCDDRARKVDQLIADSWRLHLGATTDLESLKTVLHFCKEQSLISSVPQWIVWCNTNYEQDPLSKLFGNACISIDGSMSPEEKESRILRWLQKERPILLTKPSVAGFGLNFQQCHNAAFVGLSYSFEQLFQAIRRCWRYGQDKPVDAHIVCAETEGGVLSAIRRKEAQYEELQLEMTAAMREEQLLARHKSAKYDHVMRQEIPVWLQSQA